MVTKNNPRLGYASAIKIYTVQEAADILHVYFWDLQVVCKFLQIPKAGGKYQITKEILKHLREIRKST